MEFLRFDRVSSTVVTHQKSKYCPGCDEIAPSNHNLCRVCGANLIEKVVSSNPTEGSQAVQPDFNSFFDLFGEDLRPLIEGSFNSMSTNREISIDYLSTVSRVNLGSKKNILNQISILFGPLSFPATIAEFNPQSFQETEITGEFKLGLPEFGEEDFDPSIISNSLLILKRGKVSFVTKALRAQQAGAQALIIIQNAEKWPFIMTDSSDELNTLYHRSQQLNSNTLNPRNMSSSASDDDPLPLDSPSASLPSSLSSFLSIPILMINQSDGFLLEEALKKISSSKNTSSSSSPLSLSSSSPSPSMGSIKFGSPQSDCPICREDYQSPSEVVVKLPCQHAFHLDCLEGWLKINHTCPMCRHNLPSKPAASTSIRTTSDTQNSIDNGRLPYLR